MFQTELIAGSLTDKIAKLRNLLGIFTDPKEMVQRDDVSSAFGMSKLPFLLGKRSSISSLTAEIGHTLMEAIDDPILRGRAMQAMPILGLMAGIFGTDNVSGRAARFLQSENPGDQLYIEISEQFPDFGGIFEMLKNLLNQSNQ